MAGSFTVTVDALLDVSDGITDVADAVSRHDLATVNPGADTLGDEGLASALGEFATRWSVGLRNLVGDAEHTAQALRAAASDYLGADEQAVSLLREAAGG